MLPFVRPNIRAMAGYTPGEQPRDGVFVKLNTNENPYPPSPRVVQAIQSVLADDRLRRYPDPVGRDFCQVAGRVLGVDPDGILIGNGSDDILTIITRTLVPEGGLIVSPSPSYILYRTLAEIQGGRYQEVRFTPDWRLPDPWPVRGAHLTFLPNPNSPSGTFLPATEIDRFARELNSPLLLDEAYVDFADGHGLGLLGRSNIIVTRTLSKSYSLAGIRFGFALADPALVRELVKVKDSYNCDILSLAAAAAALEDQPYRLQCRGRILATRERMTAALTKLGFDVPKSHANFVWCRRGHQPMKPIHEELKRRMILVRCMNYEGYGDGLRITVGTDAEVDRLLNELGRMG